MTITSKNSIRAITLKIPNAELKDKNLSKYI